MIVKIFPTESYIYSYEINPIMVCILDDKLRIYVAVCRKKYKQYFNLVYATCEEN